MDISNKLSRISSDLLGHYHEVAENGNSAAYPNVDQIVNTILLIRKAIFPSYFNEALESKPPEIWLQSLLADIHQSLSREIKTALLKQNDGGKAPRPASEISLKLLEQLVSIQQLLHKDAKAGFEGDPAAKGIDEVILTYPGFFAIFAYRVAHFLFLEDVHFIPRMMSEYAHRVTGIDIHPGAEIGEYFFIDHGTGVVIGETAVIGNHVKLYQGVTLGALSTKSGQKLAGIRRHPTIEDHVTIYSGATILGGETVIGKNSTIGGNVFITKSVPHNTTVKGT